MPKLPNKLLIVALLSAFAATSTVSVAAAEQRKAEKQEQQHAEKHDDGHDEHHATGSRKSGVITVTNHGSGALTITAAPTVTRTSGPGDFSIITPPTGRPCSSSVVVEPEGTCTIGVQYTSSSHETSTARVRLTDSGAETATQETEIRAN